MSLVFMFQISFNVKQKHIGIVDGLVSLVDYLNTKKMINEK